MKINGGSLYQRLHQFFLIVSISIGISILLLGAYFSHPNAEDLSLVIKPRTLGLLPSIVELLNTYDGRYFVNFLHGINPLASGYLGAYKLTIAFGILLPIFCLSYFLKSLFTDFSYLKTMLFSSSFMLINYALTPSLPHLVYWMVSSFVYLYSWCLWLLWVGSFLRFIKAEQFPKKDGYFVLALLFLICAMGMNEMFLVLNLSTIGLFCFYFLIHKSVNLKYTLPFLIAAVVLFVFFLSNNGIENRYDSFSEIRAENHTVLTLKYLIQHLGSLLLIWMKQGMLMILFLLWSVLFFHDEMDSIKIKNTWFYLLSILFTCLIMLLAFYLPMGEENVIPVRIFTSFFLVFQLLLVFTFIALYNSLFRPFLKKITINPSFLSLLIFCLMIISSFFSQNNLRLLADEYFSGKLSAYNQTMQLRYELIEDAIADSENCWKIATLPVLESRPKSIFMNPDLKSNKAEYYWNNAYEKFFNIDEVRLQGDTFFTKDYNPIMLYE